MWLTSSNLFLSQMSLLWSLASWVCRHQCGRWDLPTESRLIIRAQDLPATGLTASARILDNCYNSPSLLLQTVGIRFPLSFQARLQNLNANVFLFCVLFSNRFFWCQTTELKCVFSLDWPKVILCLHTPLAIYSLSWCDTCLLWEATDGWSSDKLFPGLIF